IFVYLIAVFVMADLEDCRLCLICYVPVTVSHFGLDACRACALFFKRAKTTGAQYSCRVGTGDCTAANDGKFMCRLCRFNRCVLVGMEYDGPMKVRRVSSVPLLHRIGKEFKAFNERRRLKEIKLMRAYRGIRMPHPTEELYHVNAQASSEIYSIAISEAFTFFEIAFPTLQQLDRREREAIFKDAFPKLNLVAGYNSGQKLWKSSSTKIMVSAVTCYDVNIPFNFSFPGMEWNNFPFKSSLSSHIGEHISVFMPILERVRLTERECHALAGLVVTEQDLPLSEQANQLLDHIRLEIFSNLHAYYRNEMGLKDYSERLGNLMSVAHTAQECSALFRVFFRMYSTMFDIQMADRMMAECILGS
ncbi:hypothetical protein PMAYCL1PPCAC_13602, partial [Pristionchus mayeri]